MSRCEPKADVERARWTALEDQLFRVSTVANSIAAIRDLVQGDASDKSDQQFELLSVGDLLALLELLHRELRSAVDGSYQIISKHYQGTPQAGGRESGG